MPWKCLSSALQKLLRSHTVPSVLSAARRGFVAAVVVVAFLFTQVDNLSWDSPSEAKPDSVQWWQYATNPFSVRLIYNLRLVSSPAEHPVWFTWICCPMLLGAFARISFLSIIQASAFKVYCFFTNMFDNVLCICF